MAQKLLYKTWDDKSNYSSKFKMTSKYTDLGSPDGKKSILGVICSISIGIESTATSHSTFAFVVRYRTSLNDNFKFLAMFNNIYVPGANNSGSLEKIKMINPIMDIRHIQLQIIGNGICSEFGINDLGLIFRTYRDSTTVNFDEG